MEWSLSINDTSLDVSDIITSEIIRHPKDIAGHSQIASINNFTLAMRSNLAQSIGIGNEVILENRELSTRGTSWHILFMADH